MPYTKHSSLFMLACGALLGALIVLTWQHVPATHAQTRATAPPDLASLAAPTIRGQDGMDVDVKSIFDAVDTSSLADVKAAIEKKDSVRFATTYKVMLESCYSCHKSVGRPYLRPMIPTMQVQSMVNLDPNASWPQ